MYWRRVQKITFTLAKLVEFLVISLFHENAIPMLDMKVHVSSNFSKKKIWKKWNLQVPWEMEVVILPSVGASFRKWGCYTPILQKMGMLYTHFPKMPGPSPYFPKKK
jgi:hypothetical protein